MSASQSAASSCAMSADWMMGRGAWPVIFQAVAGGVAWGALGGWGRGGES